MPSRARRPDRPTRARRRRTYRGEEAWLELYDRLGPSLLRRGLIDAGVSPRLAGNLVWFLEDQRLLARTQAEATRRNYRRRLAELDLDVVRRAALIWEAA